MSCNDPIVREAPVSTIRHPGAKSADAKAIASMLFGMAISLDSPVTKTQSVTQSTVAMGIVAT